MHHRLSFFKDKEIFTNNNFTIQITKDSESEIKKFEDMRAVVNKAVSKDSYSYGRKHVPVYGWIKMNYPSTISRSLYKEKKSKEHLNTETKEDINVLPQISIERNITNKIIKYRDEYGEEIILDDKLKYRKDPNKVNEEVMKEIECLIKVDHTQKFMKNYKTTDLKFFNNTFSNYDKKIRDLDIDENVFHNYNQLKKNGSRLYLYELGYKRAFAYLKTCSYAKKCDYIQENLFFHRKYTTMYPKSCILGPEEDKQFVKKCKNIGDISFDEASKESENIKNLSRLPPEYIKEEWLKLNLNSKVEMLRIDNCYWLSQDFLSKIGRLDQNLKELSLRNLEINNMIITNVVRWAKELEVLDISNCKGLSIGVCENIQKCCRNLKSLKLARLNEIITNGGLEKISLIPKLEELDISFCSQITNQGLIFLAKNKKHVLTSFDVTGLFKITNESLGQVIAQNNDTLIRIRAALLVQKGIDGDICNEIAKCKSLTNLDISGCVNIDFNNLNSLLNLRKLENLNFSGIPEVDDDLAINLVSSNRGLRILRLSNCTRISSNFLDYLINISNQLLVLEINRTPKIPEAKIEETVHKKSPNLRIIRATNLEWDMKNIGYKIPLPMKEINIEESQAKQDKNPVNQLKKLIEQNRPKRIWEILK